jgi:hypothetical protein
MQFFVVVLYVFLMVKESEELMTAGRNLISLHPAAMQYKSQKEVRIMKTKQLKKKPAGSKNAEKTTKLHLSAPASY